MYADKENYLSMMKLMKFVMLITPSNKNVEQCCSHIFMHCMKQRNQLNPKNIDHLMRIVLLGAEKVENSVWEI